MKLKIEVHESHLPVWEHKEWRYCLLMGGRGNGRSGTASRFTVSQLVSKEYTRGVIMRATREDIKASNWQAIVDRIVEEKAESQFHISEKMTLEYGQNSIRAFGFRASSGSLTARLKSIEGINYVWIEEAEEIGEDEFMKLDDTLRTVKGRIRIVLSLNTPPRNHWIIKKWFNLEPHQEAIGFYIPHLKPEIKDTIYIPGTYRENLPNLDPATVTRYQNYKNTKPAYYWQVIEGLSPEIVLGRIYSGWREIESVPHEARLLGYGLDFGFSRDPDALVAVYYHNGGYILDEKYYTSGNSYETLSEVCKLLPPAPIVADTSDGRMIEALRKSGVNVFETEKGPGSVEFGIKHVGGLKISYTATSANLKQEYENYAWFITKDGEEKRIPDPKAIYKYGDHLLDAARYFFTLMIEAGADPKHDDDREEARIERNRLNRLSTAKGLGLQ